MFSPILPFSVSLFLGGLFQREREREREREKEGETITVPGQAGSKAEKPNGVLNRKSSAVSAVDLMVLMSKV